VRDTQLEMKPGVRESILKAVGTPVKSGESEYDRREAPSRRPCYPVSLGKERCCD
jgi:hypothetical protein